MFEPVTMTLSVSAWLTAAVACDWGAVTVSESGGGTGLWAFTPGMAQTIPLLTTPAIAQLVLNRAKLQSMLCRRLTLPV